MPVDFAEDPTDQLEVWVPEPGFEVVSNVDFQTKHPHFKPSIEGIPEGAYFRNLSRINHQNEQNYMGFIYPTGQSHGRTYFPHDPSNNEKIVRVTQHQPIYLHFSKIKGCIDKAHAFINTFGTLGLGYRATSWSGLDTRTQDFREHHDQMQVEPFILYDVYSSEMANLVWLWKTLETCRGLEQGYFESALSERLLINHNNADIQNRTSLRFKRHNTSFHFENDKTTHNIIYSAAMRFLLGQINDRLKGNITYHVLMHPKTLRPATKLIPNSLFAFLWLEFSQDVARGQPLRTCKYCNTLFAPSPAEKRKRETCSDRCRKSISREKSAAKS